MPLEKKPNSQLVLKLALVRLTFVLKLLQFSNLISGREGSVSSAIEKKRKGKITSNGADGVNFQSCVWESSIQIPLTNIGVGGSDSYSPGFKNNRFTFLQFHLFLTCPCCHPGSSLPGWHLHNSTGPNVPSHLGQGSSSSKQKWKHVKNRSEFAYRPHVLMDVVWRRTGNVQWLHPTTKTAIEHQYFGKDAPKIHTLLL